MQLIFTQKLKHFTYTIPIRALALKSLVEGKRLAETKMKNIFRFPFHEITDVHKARK